MKRGWMTPSCWLAIPPQRLVAKKDSNLILEKNLLEGGALPGAQCILMVAIVAIGIAPAR